MPAGIGKIGRRMTWRSGKVEAYPDGRPWLRKRLQRGALGSIRIGPEFVEGATDHAEMN